MSLGEESYIPYLTDALLEVDARVLYRSVISPSINDDRILNELRKLMMMQTRVFIVHMTTNLATRIFSKAKDQIGMMSQGYIWLFTNGITNSLQLMNSLSINSMKGVLGAYDATIALAMAIEKVGTTSVGFPRTNEYLNSADPHSFEVSKYGTKLSQAFLVSRFEGIAGHYNLIHGLLQATTFQMIPIHGKKLRIGVPLNVQFKEFLTIIKDPNTNTTEVRGYAVDVFKAATKLLAYELIPFAKPDGTSADTDNDLVYQVHHGNFDAVVGDITIRANKYQEKKCMGFLTRDLRLTTSCFFIFIGFVVWVLEHQINEDFRGTPSHQVGTSLWFSFSTMVFAHSERVIINLARFVMIIWVFVMLMLTQSYTANLASVLTVQQLQPTVTIIRDILRNGECWLRNRCVSVWYLETVGF
ncbi:putative periplasmic binding protein-like I [Rosa chinensis]|uniref:Putative periplasmic binding protein-like I n=1 Tax=Rosa chinensis TaxID=74649 RepID=A0A2P6QP28_ROSCH|nr:putative periplasmic binding protein-like I [Rosa chinensis]